MAADPVRTLELKPQIVEQLATVYDPEIPVNIYELGLIYDIAVSKDGVAVIEMTLTAPGCPAAVTLPAEVQGKVKSIEGRNQGPRRPGLGAPLGQGPDVGRGQAATRHLRLTSCAGLVRRPPGRPHNYSGSTVTSEIRTVDSKLMVAAT